MSDATDRLFEIQIFCDFDGTISTIDIGHDFFHRESMRGGWDEQFLNGAINGREYWRGIAGDLPEPITHETLHDYLTTIPVDPGFSALLELTRSESLPMSIVSDGFDIYIEPYLAMHGGEGIPLYCNHASLDASGRMQLSFPHAAEGCNCLSVVCKRNVLLSASDPEKRIVYIGDGVSDRCPIEYADIIFAKGSLAAWCNLQRLPHYPYKTLTEVTEQLRRLLARRRLKPRHQALLQRKRAWEEG